MNMRRIVPIFILMTLLSSCGSQPEESDEQKKTQLERHLAPQLDVLDKAKAVEGQLSDAAEERRKEMEEKGI